MMISPRSDFTNTVQLPSPPPGSAGAGLPLLWTPSALGASSPGASPAPARFLQDPSHSLWGPVCPYLNYISHPLAPQEQGRCLFFSSNRLHHDITSYNKRHSSEAYTLMSFDTHPRPCKHPSQAGHRAFPPTPRGQLRPHCGKPPKICSLSL